MAENNEFYNEVEAGIIDTDDINIAEIRINPDYYIHNALMKAQSCLIKENMKEGFLQFIVMVEHIEVLCKAASRLTGEYDKDLKDFIEGEEYKAAREQGLTGDVKLANIKLKLMMREIFSQQTSTEPLKA